MVGYVLTTNISVHLDQHRAGSAVPRQVKCALYLASDEAAYVTGQTYTIDGRVEFSALIPEESFRRGQNQVEVFAVEEAVPSRLRLSQLREKRAVPYGLELAPDNTSERYRRRRSACRSVPDRSGAMST